MVFCQLIKYNYCIPSPTLYKLQLVLICLGNCLSNSWWQRNLLALFRWTQITKRKERNRWEVVTTRFYLFTEFVMGESLNSQAGNCTLTQSKDHADKRLVRWEVLLCKSHQNECELYKKTTIHCSSEQLNWAYDLWDLKTYLHCNRHHLVLIRHYLTCSSWNPFKILLQS